MYKRDEQINIEPNRMQENYRKLLTYSYNIVGSYEDAKDLVQDVLEKYISIDKTNVKNETNFLIKSTINHSINFKKRQSKKEVFGEWLPEPVSFENAETKLVEEQTASYTMLVLLENLNPKERAVFILKEGFSYSHTEIADLLDISLDNSRQLLSRASKHLQYINYLPDNFRTNLSTETLQKYQRALSEANIRELEELLVNDIKLTADGGKKVQVVRANETGKTVTAMLLSYVQQQFLTDKKFSFHTFNHQPAICFWQGSTIYNCHILQIDDSGKIQQIYSIVDPLKLKSLI
jgi:RNA polymerase sigma-70 factor (ECF subfamily)